MIVQEVGDVGKGVGTVTAQLVVPLFQLNKEKMTFMDVPKIVKSAMEAYLVAQLLNIDEMKSSCSFVSGSAFGVWTRNGKGLGVQALTIVLDGMSIFKFLNFSLKETVFFGWCRVALLAASPRLQVFVVFIL